MQPLITTQERNRTPPQDSLSLRGVYWELPVTGVEALQLHGDTLTVTGDTVSASGADTTCEVSRRIPREILPAQLLLDTSRDWHARAWHQTDLIACDSPHFTHCFREFFNPHTGTRFSYLEPFRSLYELSHTYLGEADTAVIVLAFGKKDQDQRKWMGYILVTRRHSQ